ncbi:MAG TPA: flagellar hook-associated protein FlgK [Chloroflexota bacterium]|nr:flagellar hook-associated protein FlgK [Chloroflexota bacterium]
MLPTFFGLNSVTRALLAQQEAVDVVNQNISNVNTPGYSRQDAQLQATSPYTVTAFNSPSLAGQLGTGAFVPVINRFQDELLNSQIRSGNQSVGQLQVMDDQYTQIQAIYNDPSNVAVNSAATNFFNSIQDLTNTPESNASLQLVEQNGASFTNAVSTRYSQLTTLQGDLNTKVGSIVSDVNTTIKQIAQMNNSIAQATGAGNNANDLQDQRDALVDHLSTLVDVRDVKNTDGTDTIQMNGRFLVNKDQAYTLTALTNANSSALIKPVQVFWQEDVTKFENIHPGYDPISGRNLTSNVAAVGPPLSVSQAAITTGSLAGTMNIRDQVIQNTLLPQLNELSDSFTNTQALSLNTGLTASTGLVGSAASPDDFTVTVTTPQGTATPPGPGQMVAFSVGTALAGNATPTVQNVIDAINSSSVAPYVHASLNSSGQLQIDTIDSGALVKVDKANGAASKDFGFSATVADGFNMVHVQGYGLNTPAQWSGGIDGLTLSSSITVGDQLQVTGPDGKAITITVPPVVSAAFPAPTTTTVQALISTINAKGLSHGFQAALDGSGHLSVFSTPTVYGADGHLVGTQAQVTGDNSVSFTSSTTLTAGDTLKVAGPGGTLNYTAALGDTVQTLLTAVNSANIGVTASINSVGQFQLTSVNSGSSNTVTVSNVTGTMNSILGLPLAGTAATGLDHGYPPSSSVTVTNAGGANTAQDFFGDPTGVAFPKPVSVNNSNQLFFQGSQQALAGQALAATPLAGVAQTFTTASVPAVTQLTGPQALNVAIFPRTGVAAFGTVTVTGTDAATGLAATETLTFAGTGVQTTAHTFSSITSIATSAGFNNVGIQVEAALTGTQKDTAGSIVVDSGVAANPSLIAASNAPGAAGNDANALALLNIQQQAVVTDGQTAATIGDFYANITESLGGAAQQTKTNMTSQQQLVQALTNQKQSVVGVNLDEEAAKLVALQHAYQAAARAITTQDSMLDTIITGMGLVGR